MGGNKAAFFKYNPGRNGPDALRAVFTGRDSLLAGLLEELRARSSAPVNQHCLITAPWGMGKTHFLAMLRLAVADDDDLAAAYLPVQTAEEEYGIADLCGFLARIIALVLESDEDTVLAGVQEAILTAPPEEGVEQAIGALKDYRDRKKRKILLLADNFDRVLGSQLRDDAEIGRLRDLLMNESFLVVVATARASFREVTGYDRPFYNFFKPLALEALTPDQMKELVDKLAAWHGDQGLQEKLESLQPLIHGAHHLVGGNPRMGVILYTHLARDATGAAAQILKGVLDDLTPEYKAKWDALSPQLRRVVALFAGMGRAATPTELAGEARLPVNQVNSLLKRLREMGLVGIGPQKRRKTTLYQVWDRPFRLWHALRTSAQSAHRAEGFIEFVHLWYTCRLAPEQLMPWEAESPLLGECALAVKQENSGQARTLFKEALEAMPSDGGKEARHTQRAILFGFFLSIVSGHQPAICEDLLNILSKERPSLYQDLSPFTMALDHEKEAPNQETLDRLPPELRTLITAIKKGGEEK